MLFDIVELLNESTIEKFFVGVEGWGEVGANFIFVGFALLAIWLLFWKGLALWVAAKNDQPKWFIALLAINTLGLFEIGFLLYHYRKGSINKK